MLVSARLPPGHCSPSGVLKCRFSVANSKPSFRRLPLTRPVTDEIASGSSFLPSCTFTSRSATSIVAALGWPLVMSAQARRLPLPERGSMPKVLDTYCLMRDTSPTRLKSAYSCPVQSANCPAPSENSGCLNCPRRVKRSPHSGGGVASMRKACLRVLLRITAST